MNERIDYGVPVLCRELEIVFSYLSYNIYVKATRCIPLSEALRSKNFVGEKT